MHTVLTREQEQQWHKVAVELFGFPDDNVCEYFFYR